VPAGGGEGERLTRLTAGLPDGDAALVCDAYRLAEAAHRGQSRKHGTPYIGHPLAVAETLRELGIDNGEMLAAALLHDTLEDTTVGDRELAESPLPGHPVVGPRLRAAVERCDAAAASGADPP
jgi:(p)ppGpp synthase/HD superfamily hydrolase